MANRVHEFNEFRSKMNKRILDVDNRAIKRFFGVDTLTYEPGALDAKTKEMLGLVASMVAIRVTSTFGADDDGVELLDEHMLQCLGAIVRSTDTLFRFGYPGCYAILLAGTDDPLGPRTWVAAFVAALGSGLINASAFIVVITMIERRFGPMAPPSGLFVCWLR